MTRLRLLVALPLLALPLLALPLLALSGCGGAHTPADEPAGGVSGVVWLAPTCPVEQEGQPCDAERAGGVKVWLSAPASDDGVTGRSVASAMSDDDGRFAIAVEPGSYLLTADAGMFCKPLPVDVPTDGQVTVDLSCDTGIR